MISIDNLRVKYKDKTALDIRQKIIINSGDKVGIIGSNGAGKTTLIKAILGIVEYTGNINCSIDTADIAVHMQQNYYSENVSVKTVIEMILATFLKNSDTANELIDFFDFRKCLNKRFHKLSGGEKQRHTLILVMCKQSPITIFDEVSSGLDFETRQRLIDKIKEYYKDKNTTVLFVSHYYDELENLANKILYIDEGKIKAYGDKQELFHKACGKNIIIVKNSDKNLNLFKKYRRLNSPSHLLAYGCSTKEEEERIIRILFENNIDYKRSSSDIEIMSMNI